MISHVNRINHTLKIIIIIIIMIIQGYPQRVRL